MIRRRPLTWHEKMAAAVLVLIGAVVIWTLINLPGCITTAIHDIMWVYQ